MELLELLSCFAVLSGSFTYLGKKIIETAAKNSQKQFESELKTKAEREIEHFKSQIEIENLHLKVKIAGVYEKQADALIRIYESIGQLELSLESLLSQGSYKSENSKELFDVFVRNFNELYVLHHKNNIFLSNETDGFVVNFFDRSRDIAIRNQMRVSMHFKPLSDADLKLFYENESNIEEGLEKLKVTKKKIKEDFSELLGAASVN
ncbi:MAG: hypothetical protein ACPGUD_12505 [Parashewanella sp.]